MTRRLRRSRQRWLLNQTKPLILKVERDTTSARWPAMAAKPQVIRIHKDTFFSACVRLKRMFEFQSFV